MDTIFPSDLPDCQNTVQGTPRQVQALTAANVAYVLKRLGVTLRYNVMTATPVMLREGMTTSERDQETLYMQLCDTLTMLDIKNHSRLGEVLGVVSRRDSFHPMQDWITSEAWDGVCRMGNLVATVPTNSPNLAVYLRHWLIQAVEAVRGWEDDIERSLPHVLVFVGGQGMGKGRWLRHLAPGFVKADAELHLAGVSAKDHQLEVLRSPIAELGEIDSTFRKSDISSLKSFLSRPVDSIREPYARRAVSRHRGTVFAGTVNDLQFLSDPTGARRFWPVEVTGKLTWDHGINMQQLWAQANTWWEDGFDYVLDEAADKERRRELDKFTMVTPEVEAVAGHWELYRDVAHGYAAMNKTEIMRVSGLRNPSMAATAHVTQWLINALGAPKKIHQRKRCWLFPVGQSGALVPHLTLVPAANHGPNVGPATLGPQ